MHTWLYWHFEKAYDNKLCNFQYLSEFIILLLRKIGFIVGYEPMIKLNIFIKLATCKCLIHAPKSKE